ncbi:flagellin [Sphingomonas sp. Leaf242]|uniref:flagellin n=1 Tax=Sphingomonas sp. Leaf242 TaxID=1736304 RepID=UPI0007151F57|nr:flagellin [Sphingomonas sp. Leaf242]KQO05261.1 flagellin [Sphingomonas sp. Leaf242]
MIRVATLPFQNTLSQAIQRAQSKLAATQTQLNTGKKASTLAGLGTDAARTLSARTVLARQESQSASATRLGTTLSLYDANITSIDTGATDLRQSILTAIGTGSGAGLQASIDSAFGQFRTALNATDGSGPLFGGSQTGDVPFKPATLADTIGATPATAFANDLVRASARVAEGTDLTYGVVASDLGSTMLAAFRTLAEAGTIGDKMTAAQKDALGTAVNQIATALTGVRAVNAENGRKQSQVETLATRGEERATLLKDSISRVEDADFGQISTDLAQQQSVLKASYSVFGQLTSMSLVDYLK